MKVWSITLSFFLILFAVSSLYAQKQGQALIDSLDMELEKPKTDKEKVIILNDLSWENRLAGNPKVAMKQSEEAIALAQKIGFKNGIASAHNGIGAIYRQQSNYAEALKHYRASMKIREEIGDREGVAISYNNIGIIYVNQGDYTEALKYYSISLKIREELGDRGAMSAVYNNIGNAYQNQGNNPEALKNHLASLKISEELGNKRGIADSYNNIGIIHHHQGNYAEALKNYLASLKTRVDIGDKERLAQSYNNVGTIYHVQGNHSDALNNYFASLKLREEVGDRQGMSFSYDNIAVVYRKEGNYDKALEYFENALKLSEEINDKSQITRVTKNLGDLYLSTVTDTARGEPLFEHISAIANDAARGKEHRLKMAIDYLQQAADSAKEIGALTLYQQTQKSLSRAYALSGRYQVALEAYQEHTMYKDSLFNEQNTRKLTRLEVQYEADKKQDSLRFAADQEQLTIQKEMQLAALRYEYERKQAQAQSEEERRQLLIQEEMKRQQIESDHAVAQAESKRREVEMLADQQQKEAEAQVKIEREKGFRNVSLAGLVLIAGVGGLLFYQNRARKRHNEKLHLLNTELDQANRIKTRFFSILNHDLRSPVSNLIHFLHLKNENPELLDDETKTRLEQKTTQGAENLLVTMEDLLLWSKGQMENFEPKPDKISVNQLFEDTKKVFPGYQRIQFEYYNPDNIELVTDENYLKTIIRNLTSNAINVFTTTENPRIVWRAFQQNGKTNLSITDNGPGADSEKFKALYDDKEVIGIKTGLGLHLIRDLAKAVDCKIEVDTIKGKGTTIVLRFL